MADRVRLIDIARECGVSVAAVSVALNKPDDICDLAAATRDRIRRTARDLNYHPHWAGQALQAQRTGLVGLFTQPNVGLHNEFNGRVLHGLTQRLADEGCHLVLVTVRSGDAAWQEAIRQRRFDAAVILNAVPGACEQELAEAHLRTVWINAPDLDGQVQEGADQVVVDDLQVVDCAMDHLHALGHRRFVYYRRPVARRTHGSEALRQRGFRAWCRRHRWTSGVVVDSEVDLAAALQADDRPTAVLAYTDAYALRAIRIAHALGRTVPNDLSVVGIDGTDWTALLTPALTSVAIPAETMGASAAALILEPASARIAPLQGTLVVRESTAASRRGFTLVELLVVITIIAVLAGLLIPSIALVQSRARTMSCLSNLRQVGIAIAGYAGDNQDILPSAQLPGGGYHWYEIIAPYAGVGGGSGPVSMYNASFDAKNVVGGCPNYKRTMAWRLGYAINHQLALPHSPRRSLWNTSNISMGRASDFVWSAVTHPSTRILVGDSDQWTLGVSLNGPTWNYGDPGPRHRDRAAWLHVDLHVATYDSTRAARRCYDPENAP